MQKWRQNLRLGAFAATVVCMLVGFTSMFNQLRFDFSDPLQDMSHGWLVPVFSLYVLWTQRAALKEEVGAPSVWGFLVCLPCIAVALLGSRGMQVRLEQMGFIGLCMALPWAFFGRRVAKRCVFPALFLLFTVSIASFLDAVTIHLRLFASGTAFVMLRGFGVDVVQIGTAIVSQGAHPFSIDVAEPCSGLRSLVALTALTAAYAWYTQPTWWRRAALFACAIPLAVLGNVVRILSICFVAAWSSQDFALGFYHDYSGYVVFIVAIACMVACGEIISRWCARRKRYAANAQERVPPVADAQEGAPPAADAQERVPPAALKVDSPFSILHLLLSIGLCALFLFQAQTPQPQLADAPLLTWPDSLGGYVAGDILYCQNENCSQCVFTAERDPTNTCSACGTVLKGWSLAEDRLLVQNGATIQKRVYTLNGDMTFIVSAVISGPAKSSIHRPELCLSAQGGQMSHPVDFTVAGRPYHAIQVDTRRDPPSQLVYTFFNQEGVRTASHLRRIFLDTWDRSVNNRVDRWVMLTVRVVRRYSESGVVMSRPRDRVEIERFLRKVEEVLP